MKKWIVTVLSAVLCLALLVCLTGCSSSGSGTGESASGEPESAVTGSWSVVGIDDGSEILTGDDLSMIGQDTTVLINDGGKCSFDTNGDVVDGTWELKDDTITMKLGSTTLTGTVKPNEIDIEGGMTLQRTEEGYQG